LMTIIISDHKSNNNTNLTLRPLRTKLTLVSLR
jgi:hypothetical protein